MKIIHIVWFALAALVLEIFSTPGFGSVLWIKMRSDELQCSITCSRVRMERVVAGRNPKGNSYSVCATNVNDRFMPGFSLSDSRPICQSNFSGKPTSGIVNYCLCADDGLNAGTDYSWIENENEGRCDLKCKSTTPSYRYAVYASSLKESWLHVCAAGGGRIGFTGGGKTGCTVADPDSQSVITEQKFGCLCTGQLGGDLDHQLEQY